MGVGWLVLAVVGGSAWLVLAVVGGSVMGGLYWQVGVAGYSRPPLSA